MLVCVLALALGSVAAQAETTGIYVAPKFLMMWQNNWSDMDVGGVPSGPGGTSSVSLNKSQFTLGGALAVGYDFYPQHKLPIRLELEFAMRGDNKFSDDYSTSYQYNDGQNHSGIAKEEISVKYNASTLLANVYWDFHNSSAFTPYVMAGAGLAFINAKYEYNVGTRENAIFGNPLEDAGSASFSENKHFTNFAWALGAGCAYNFNENFAIDLGYRYLNLGSVKADGSGKGTYKTPGTPTTNVINFNYEGKSFASNHEIMLGLRYTF